VLDDSPVLLLLLLLLLLSKDPVLDLLGLPGWSASGLVLPLLSLLVGF